ncbi:ATP-binding protein [Flammeovirgaceae bacterium SG7u.111]|nr:ATP-binding protein [Flammeovirgaceae bacterium SG7u.132]WPO33790.1 ATP-binding protein [Flammeovirgaceae bacterium SG7u.111]
MKLSKFTYLILSAVSLLLAVALRAYYLSEPNYELYVKRVTENFELETVLANNQIFELQNVVKKKGEQVNFSDFYDVNAPFPAFVFKNEELIFWSDNSINIPLKWANANFIDKSEAYNNSIYYVTRSRFTNGYQIVVVIPLKRSFSIENQYFTSHLNKDIFPEESVEIVLSKEIGEPIYNSMGRYAFSLDFPEEFSYYSDKQIVVLMFIIISIVFLFLFIRKAIHYLLQRNKSLQAFSILLGFVVGLRTLMLTFKLPHSIIDTAIFDPDLFSSSFISPSLGDMLLNMILLAMLLGFVATHLSKLINLKRLESVPRLHKKVLSFMLIVLTYVTIYALYQIYHDVYVRSGVSLDITTDFHFPTVKIIAYIIFIIMVLIYFTVCNLAARLLNRLGFTLYATTVVFVAGSLFYYLITMFLDSQNIVIFNVNAIYFAAITYLSFPQSLRSTNYKTFVYLFTCSAACAIVGSYAVYRGGQEIVKKNKSEYASLLSEEHDSFAEFKLNEINAKVGNDPIIKNRFIGTEFSEDEIKRKIKFYIPNYFDKYDLNIRLFQSSGEEYGNTNISYNTLIKIYNKESYRTDSEQIFFISEVATGKNRYLSTIPLKRNGEELGFIVLDFTLKKNVPNSIYPPFLDDEFASLNKYNEFSYAVYQNERLAFSSGEFNYDNNFLELFKHEKGFLQSELETKDHDHLRRLGENNNKNVIVTSEKYPLGRIYSNFSFLFLMLIFIMMFMILAINYSPKERKENINFATRIQLYLNLAFFLPLVFVSVITVSILTSSNQSETQSYYLEKAISVSQNITDDFNEFIDQSTEANALNEVIARISKFAQSDINIFDNSGKLLVASQEYIFDNDLQARLANPDAIINIIENNQAKLMANESLGDLRYNSAYVGIRSPDSREILGIVGIPFFGSKYKFDQQIIDLLTTIMNVFTASFGFLLLLSYLSVRSLINPLVMVTQKIKKISLSNRNESIDYYSNDEIGLLIGEYNKMLVKLEESKSALAKSQKESAWREVAKQVAHEIKNPLTPMRLSLQQLERVLPEENERSRRAIAMLLNQIETLNDITTSFSNFAQMPVPSEEKFEISSVLNQTITLYDGKELVIKKEIPKGEFYVNGDPQLMSRIFTNLILNGIQAVPPEKDPELRIRLRTYDPNRVLMEFEDNGLGIPELIQNKIFIQNFSTKSNGSGIGLAIAKRGIEHSGGNIWFETKKGEGTVFYIEMPLHSN